MSDFLLKTRQTGKHVKEDFYYEYDSTWEDWETDEHEHVNKRKTLDINLYSEHRSRWCHRNLRAAKDMQNYRHGYPDRKHEEDDAMINHAMVNLKFYLNKVPNSPDGVKIEEFHRVWKGDYERLEQVHSYIQWLFPLQEPGMNYFAQELTREEIEEFHKNSEAKGRLVKSYELMLDFYGIELMSKRSGAVGRSHHWQERFENLNWNTHNNLRITRILKCLGQLGFQHYQAPLVRFFLQETLVNGTLQNVKQSVLDYFLFAICDKTQRRELIEFALQHYRPEDEFVWCPIWVQEKLREKPVFRQKADEEEGLEGHLPEKLPVDGNPENESTENGEKVCKGNPESESPENGESDCIGNPEPESTENEERGFNSNPELKSTENGERGCNSNPESKSTENEGRGFNSNPELKSTENEGRGFNSNPELKSTENEGRGFNSNPELKSTENEGRGFNSNPESKSTENEGRGFNSNPESKSTENGEKDSFGNPEPESPENEERGFNSNPEPKSTENRENDSSGNPENESTTNKEMDCSGNPEPESPENEERGFNSNPENGESDCTGNPEPESTENEERGFNSNPEPKSTENGERGFNSNPEPKSTENGESGCNSNPESKSTENEGRGWNSLSRFPGDYGGSAQLVNHEKPAERVAAQTDGDSIDRKMFVVMEADGAGEKDEGVAMAI